MTTIAYDGRYLAADGLATQGDFIDSYCAKKVIYKSTGEDQYLIATVGRVDDAEAFAAWLGSKEPYPNLDQETFEAIVIKRNRFESQKAVRYYGKSKHACSIPLKYATGSGGVQATCALALGMNAVHAVVFASTLCASSGGDITVYDTLHGFTQHDPKSFSLNTKMDTEWTERLVGWKPSQISVSNWIPYKDVLEIADERARKQAKETRVMHQQPQKQADVAEITHYHAQGAVCPSAHLHKPLGDPGC